MNRFSKILKAAAVFAVSALVLAACAGDREIESFRIVGPEPEFADGILTLNEGESAQLGGRVTFDNETTDAVLGALIDWSSSNPDAVSVNETGVVTAHEWFDGATITGMHKGYQDSITVVVVLPEEATE